MREAARAGISVAATLIANAKIDGAPLSDIGAMGYYIIVAAAGHGLTPLSAGYLIGFAVVLVLLGGVQGRPWAIWVNLGIQVVLIAGWLVHGAVGFIGVVFTAVWVLIAYLRAEVLRRQKRGLLPGQQSPPD